MISDFSPSPQMPKHLAVKKEAVSPQAEIEDGIASACSACTCSVGRSVVVDGGGDRADSRNLKLTQKSFPRAEQFNCGKRHVLAAFFAC